jgi:hypothetical protein
MSYSSYINNPSYVVPSYTSIPENVQTFYNSTEVQAYLNNDPTTSYTLTNLYQNEDLLSYYAQTIPAFTGMQFTSIMQSVYDDDPDNIEIIDITVPAGTYNLSMTATINCPQGQDEYVHSFQLVVYNRAGGDANPDAALSCPLGIAISSTSNMYNTVTDTAAYVCMNDTQRVVLTADTVVSMALKTVELSSDAVMYYGNNSNNILNTASFTFTPTI